MMPRPVYWIELSYAKLEIEWKPDLRKDGTSYVHWEVGSDIQWVAKFNTRDMPKTEVLGKGLQHPRWSPTAFCLVPHANKIWKRRAVKNNKDDHHDHRSRVVGHINQQLERSLKPLGTDASAPSNLSWSRIDISTMPCVIKTRQSCWARLRFQSRLGEFNTLWRSFSTFWMPTAIPSWLTMWRAFRWRRRGMTPRNVIASSPWCTKNRLTRTLGRLQLSHFSRPFSWLHSLAVQEVGSFFCQVPRIGIS